MRRLISRRAGPSHDVQVLAVPLLEHFSRLMPECCINGRSALHFLSGTRKADGGGSQLALSVPEEEHVDVVVFVPLEPAEIRAGSAAVHLGRAVGKRRSAVLGYDGMPQSPTNLGWLA